MLLLCVIIVCYYCVYIRINCVKLNSTCRMKGDISYFILDCFLFRSLSVFPRFFVSVTLIVTFSTHQENKLRSPPTLDFNLFIINLFSEFRCSAINFKRSKTLALSEHISPPAPPPSPFVTESLLL